jgi:hypothetical protein
MHRRPFQQGLSCRRTVFSGWQKKLIRVLIKPYLPISFSLLAGYNLLDRYCRNRTSDWLQHPALEATTAFLTSCYKCFT